MRRVLQQPPKGSCLVSYRTFSFHFLFYIFNKYSSFLVSLLRIFLFILFEEKLFYQMQRLINKFIKFLCEMAWLFPCLHIRLYAYNMTITFTVAILRVIVITSAIHLNLCFYQELKWGWKLFSISIWNG